MNLHHLPKRYSDERLSRKDLHDNPIAQLQNWLNEALDANVPELNAMALATATPNGKPSCRIVLLKEAEKRGVVFFTNYESRKATELHSNPFAMATLFWSVLMRQVCVEGAVEKISTEESWVYFSKRPRGSQIGAWASPQDKVISSFEVLEDSYKGIEARFRDQEIPLPPFWGGFRIIPSRFEFWQGGKDRLHDRFQYTLENGQWKIDRLAP